MSSWGAVQLSKLPRPMRMLFREVVRNSIISFERSIRNALRRITDVSSAPARALFGGGTALRRRCTHTGGVRACRLSSVGSCTLFVARWHAWCQRQHAPRRVVNMRTRTHAHATRKGA